MDLEPKPTLRSSSNLKVWEQYGDNLLVVQPFMDSLIVRGEGCYLIDAEGNRILDMAAGQFCAILGHNHRGFISRLQQQLDILLHLGDQYVSPSILKATSRLAGIAPGDLSKVVFLSTGSEANECAMRMAKAVTGRTGMLGFTRGYYGISLATRNLSSISDYPEKVDFQPAPINQYKLLTPTCSRCPIKLQNPSCNSACLDVSLEMIAHHLEGIAAVIVEPVFSAGGMIFPPKDYLHGLYSKTHEMGALFIVDEAQTGFGRCGQWFDIQNYELEPDILVVSKTAGNGYPVAAVVVSEAVAKKLESQGFTHLSSHQNDPLAAAAVHAVIDIVEEEKLVEHSREMGVYFLDKLKCLQRKHPLIADVRGRGLMIGLELSDELQSGRSTNIAFNMAMLCERKGLHITFSYFEPVIRFIPPLIVSAQEIDITVGIIDDVLSSLQKGSENFSRFAPQNRRSGPFIEEMNNDFSLVKLWRRIYETSPKQWIRKLKTTL